MSLAVWTRPLVPSFLQSSDPLRTDLYLAQANKLSRTYATLLEALNRHRSKGQQKVTVEHVHVYSGGQAVVGMVEGPGGGDRTKSEDQPDSRSRPEPSAAFS
jgi:hypothetical protein